MNHYPGRKPDNKELSSDGFIVTATKQFCCQECYDEWLSKRPGVMNRPVQSIVSTVIPVVSEGSGSIRSSSGSNQMSFFSKQTAPSRITATDPPVSLIMDQPSATWAEGSVVSSVAAGVMTVLSVGLARYSL